MEIKGVAAIVTGGASGLGGATAARLASAGAKVTIFDLNAELGEAHARAIGGAFAKVDVTDETAVVAAITEAEGRNGVARIVVNCAGVATGARLIGRDGQAAPLAGFAKVVGVNLIGVFNVMSKAAARLVQADPLGEERGVIVNTASIAAFEGQIGQGAYAASKGGVAALTLPAARELARYGVRVMAIAPGVFMTPMMAGFSEEVQASVASQVPFPSRFGRPEEYAQLVESIVANPMLNGEVIRLDGAMRMQPK